MTQISYSSASGPMIEPPVAMKGLSSSKAAWIVRFPAGLSDRELETVVFDLCQEQTYRHHVDCVPRVCGYLIELE